MDNLTIYYDVVALTLEFVVVCRGPFLIQTSRMETVNLILVIAYWGCFIAAVVFGQKIHGVELMFTIQFAYFSLAPVVVNCPPFSSFGTLRYSLGWNTLPFQLYQTSISSNYSALGIQSNFVSNVNFMVLPLVVCPLVYLLLAAAGKHSTHYRTKPRLLIYGKAFLLDIPFTILLINAPNISASFVVNFQAFDSYNSFANAVSIVTVLLLLVLSCLFFYFRGSFR